MNPAEPSTERTDQGEQVLVAGVEPVTTRERLALRAGAALTPRAPQRALDIGLFDTAARQQLDLLVR